VIPLINKLDTFELVRDKIAQILADEIAGQVSQAGANADAYRLHVYTERANPWNAWLFSEIEQIDPTPFVNVFYEADTFNRRSGNIVESQETEAVYNFDCYGLGIGAETLAGHLSADQAAALESHRAARLVRNILMASEYTYLGLRALVSERWVDRRVSFPPPKDLQTVQRVGVTRLVLRVKFVEYSPQYEPVDAELLHIELKRDTDGRVLSVLEYAFTP
jgi:hypothetical protein